MHKKEYRALITIKNQNYSHIPIVWYYVNASMTVLVLT